MAGAINVLSMLVSTASQPEHMSRSRWYAMGANALRDHRYIDDGGPYPRICTVLALGRSIVQRANSVFAVVDSCTESFETVRIEHLEDYI